MSEIGMVGRAVGLGWIQGGSTYRITLSGSGFCFCLERTTVNPSAASTLSATSRRARDWDTQRTVGLRRCVFQISLLHFDPASVCFGFRFERTTVNPSSTSFSSAKFRKHPVESSYTFLSLYRWGLLASLSDLSLIAHNDLEIELTS